MSVTLTCAHCGRSFARRWTNPDDTRRKFCTRQCCGLATRQEAHPNWRGGYVERLCETCEAPFTVHAHESTRGRGRFCSRACATVANTGAGSGTWKGGRRIHPDGAVRIRLDRRDVQEHIHVAAKALGKPLPPRAVVHHVNGDRTDNRPSNLVICQDQAYHCALHRRQRVRNMGGDPFRDKVCGRCQTPKPLSEFSAPNQGMCRPCHAIYERARKARQREAA